ncbi:MAG: N(4)-(beta-N-acetylglucosaminyl)-L-asparaginase [FCB group bacterium]|jgi:isoaspartyl peptidase/L-asparaginase-like protein (Ntn-hydrolase superfamily)
MGTRREFFSKITLATLGLMTIPSVAKLETFAKYKNKSKHKKPIVISTWQHGLAANDAAWKILNKSGRALDAVEQGVRIPEGDPNVTSVGYGGFPDRDGYVTLDACIIDEHGNCGSVAFLQNIMHPISVARLVMEKTPHIMLVGDGAFKFALDNGFKKENLLTEKAKTEWQKWLKDNNYTPAKFDNHDTIGMTALDMDGNLSGACTTSGLAWKYHGRVGDSPIIGAGLYVDNEVGAASATGKGEAVIKMAGSFLIVELMRSGKTPQEACILAIERIVKKQPDYKDFQVGFIALDKYGNTGAYSIQKGFQYALYEDDQNKLYDSDFYSK